MWKKRIATFLVVCLLWGAVPAHAAPAQNGEVFHDTLTSEEAAPLIVESERDQEEAFKDSSLGLTSLYHRIPRLRKGRRRLEPP